MTVVLSEGRCRRPLRLLVGESVLLVVAESLGLPAQQAKIMSVQTRDLQIESSVPRDMPLSSTDKAQWSLQARCLLGGGGSRVSRPNPHPAHHRHQYREPWLDVGGFTMTYFDNNNHLN